MVNNMKCMECSTTKLYIDNNVASLGFGWPLYYLGGEPTKPELAEGYFCGPDCSNKYHTKVYYATKINK